MRIGGDVHVTGPDALKKLKDGEEVTFDDGKKWGYDFRLKVSDSKEETIDFSLWIDISEEDITIMPFDDITGFESGDFPVRFKNAKGKILEIDISFDQALALKDYLESCLSARDSILSAFKERPVKRAVSG